MRAAQTNDQETGPRKSEMGERERGQTRRGDAPHGARQPDDGGLLKLIDECERLALALGLPNNGAERKALVAYRKRAAQLRRRRGQLRDMRAAASPCKTRPESPFRALLEQLSDADDS